MESLLRDPRVRDDGLGLILLPAAELIVDRVAMPVGPCGLDEHAAHVLVADLGDRPPSGALAAARRVLADRDRFALDADALAAWEAMNARAPREVPGLRRLMRRPSPFTD